MSNVYYLAGPMKGYPEWNHPAFHSAAAELRNRGYNIINPAEYGNLIRDWVTCMKRDIHALLWCDAVIVLPDWQMSRGASLEILIAQRLYMPVYELNTMMCDCHTGYLVRGRQNGKSKPLMKHTPECEENRMPLMFAEELYPEY